MNLLIFTPTWIDPTLDVTALHPKCRASIEAQRFDADWRWVIGLDNPYPIPDHRNVLHQYQQAQALFLAGDYDALLTIEHDNVLPDETAIQRLLNTPGDVIYAPYVLRHGLPVLSTWQYIGDRALGMPLDQYPSEVRRACAEVIWPVSGAGMGCTLFRRAALEVIAFKASSEDNPCPDLGFALEALRQGFKSYGRFDVPVAHYSKGRWLYPFKEYGMNYLAQETGQVSADGRIIRLTKGSPINLSDEEAQILLSIGKISAEPIEEATPETARHPIIDANDGISPAELSEAGRVLHEASASPAAVTAPPSRRNRAKANEAK
jgi:hypothetical protein